MKKLYLLGSLFLSSFLFSQELEAKLNTTTIKIGEPILLEYVVPYQKGDRIQFPQLKDSLNHHIQVLDQKIDTINGKIIHQLDLTAYDAGQFLIPSLKIEKNGAFFKTPSFQIDVQDVIIDTAQSQVNPIKPVMEETYTFTDYWQKYWIYGIAALILFVLAATLLILYIRSKSRKLNHSEPKTPYEEAIFALKEMDDKKLLKRNEQKEYYTHLSYIIRRYVGKVYQFSALELLSDDLILFISQQDDIKDDTKKNFKQFMFDADLAKFAQQEFDEAKNTTYRKWVEEFVEQIKPIDLPENISNTVDQVTGENYKKWDNS